MSVKSKHLLLVKSKRLLQRIYVSIVKTFIVSKVESLIAKIWKLP